MSNERRFEDSVSVKDLMTMDDKELMANIYIQTLKTNGQVKANTQDIECLQKEMKDKIGWKIFATLTGVITFVFVLFQVLNYFKGV